ncbi:head-tail connector protein [Tsuneonella sp. HG222]
MMFELSPFARSADYGEGVVPLADMKAHLAIDAEETEFDDLVSVFRDAAVDMVERYCEVRLAECAGIEWSAEALPRRLRLPVWPVTQIAAVRYRDGDGTAREIDVNGLRVGARGEIKPAAGQEWPTDVDSELFVEFNAGFDETNRPPALVQAVKMFTAHLFANREAVITGTISGEIPLGFRALCASFVPVRV